MKEQDLGRQLAEAHETIRGLQDELAETNRGLVALTMELEKRVDERTAELRATHVELSKTNSELMQLTLELEDRVAERKQAETALLISNRQISEILESIQDGFFALDRAWCFTYVNQRAANNVGFTPEELIGQNLWEKFPKIIGTPHETHYRKAMVERVAVHFEVKGVLTAPSYDIRVYPSADGISAYWVDITESKRAEAALRESEERYKSMFENNRAVMVLTDPVTGTLVDANPAACDFYGYRREELRGKKVAEINTLTKEQLNVVFQQALMAEKNHFYFKHRLASGEIRDVELYSAPIRLRGQRMLYSIIYDVTEHRRAEEEIQKLNQDLTKRAYELETANRELEAFAYSVSHDLRAPLRHIDGFIELLQKRAQNALDDQSQHYLVTIASAAKQMGTLIDDLLTFSRMGRSEMFKTQVDLGTLAAEVIKELEPEAGERNIQWLIADLPSVHGDRAMLRIVFLNLIANALKFTRHNEDTQVEIDCIQDDPGEVTIFVRDNGVGFDMKYVDKLFNVFQRLHRVEAFEGTGIGLANVRRIINRHGGRTWAEGQIGQGATFYFSLPTSG